MGVWRSGEGARAIRGYRPKPGLASPSIAPASAMPYLRSVQLSEKASAEVLNGRPSRSRFQERPAASTPLRTRRVPSAGTSTVQTPRSEERRVGKEGRQRAATTEE